jgi:cysteine-rich repeat protein
MRKLLAVFGALAVLAASPQPAAALFHIAVIDEVMTSYGGDDAAQFVEIRMEFDGQTVTKNSVLAAFGADGSFLGDVLVVPANIENGGNGLHWLMGTTALETAAGISVDFEFTAGLVTQSGMICWGGGGGVVPADPPDWDREDLTNYVDCVAYGAYTGPTHAHSGTPTPLSPDGHSLRRIGHTEDNAADFACGDPADPTNNDGTAGSLAATAPCPVCGDNTVDPGEQCDDGNTVDGDACPADCLGGETLVTKGQQACIVKLHGAGNGVAKASSGVVKSCVAALQKGEDAAALACIAADAKGKRAKAIAKTLATETKSCTGANTPSFLTEGGAAWNSGGRNASEFALLDLFQDAVPAGDLDDALVTKAANPAGAKCQAAAIAQLARAVDGFLKTSQRLHKTLMKGSPTEPPPTGSNAQFADALEAALAGDPKLAKLETQVGAAIVKACPAFDGLFGAVCNAETTPAGLGACIYRTGACEACLGVGTGSGLPLDCVPFGGADCIPQS